MIDLGQEQIKQCDGAIQAGFGMLNLDYAKADDIAPFCYRLRFELPSAKNAVADMQVRVDASVVVAVGTVRIDGVQRDDWIRVAVYEALCRIASECPYGQVDFDFANSLLVARFDLPSPLFLTAQGQDEKLVADLVYTPLAVLDKYYTRMAGVASGNASNIFGNYGAAGRLHKKTLCDAEEKDKTIKRLRDELEKIRWNVSGTRCARKTASGIGTDPLVRRLADCGDVTHTYIAGALTTEKDIATNATVDRQKVLISSVFGIIDRQKKSSLDDRELVKSGDKTQSRYRLNVSDTGIMNSSIGKEHSFMGAEQFGAKAW